MFIFAVLERWLIYDCETDCSFVYLIFAVLLDKFNHAIFEFSSFNHCLEKLQILLWCNTVPETLRGSQNFKSRSCGPFATLFDLILHFFDSAASTKSVCAI